MIKKIKSIGHLGVFKDFTWDKEVLDSNGRPQDFKTINVIYGRNYSGKTTLSRIFRAMELGAISDRFDNPRFCTEFHDGIEITQSSLANHGQTVRVFNEDFVRDNLRFISNPDDSVESFAILGADNSKIELEIEALEAELGKKEEGKESGLYKQRSEARKEYAAHKTDYNKASAALTKQLSDKATDRRTGIKYKPERFGDQNYTVAKLERDIGAARDPNYQPVADDQLDVYEKLISEKVLRSIPQHKHQDLQFSHLAEEAKKLVSRKISESGKLEELVKDAVLNSWVNKGRHLHSGPGEACGFCGNLVTADRWEKLEKHFDEESSKLEQDLDGLTKRIETEKKSSLLFLSINNSLFYSNFHNRLSCLADKLNKAASEYTRSLDEILLQLASRKQDILNPKNFHMPGDFSTDLLSVLKEYEAICIESEAFSGSLATEQNKAREALRLNEVRNYLATIGYESQLSDIDSKRRKFESTEKAGRSLSDLILQKENLVAAKKRELNDEEEGAKKVNKYLNDFFGHQFLSLQAKQDEAVGEEPKRIRFEVIRDRKKAYHLSEGECSLLAFCYFLAKLDDIDTKGLKPIIWIDDPISSLDGNHIFFIYSLLSAEIVSNGKFSQLFVSTHNLDFLKYLKRLNGKFVDADGKKKDYSKGYFVVTRHDKLSVIQLMPKYLKEYVTEFNYLFHQIYKSAAIATIDDTNYVTFYNFPNNARKFLEIYLYYRNPDQGMSEETLQIFFGDESVPSILIDRMNNEYSHLSGVFERGSTPVEVPEMQSAARLIIEKLKEDKAQYSALLKSIGEVEPTL